MSRWRGPRRGVGGGRGAGGTRSPPAPPRPPRAPDCGGEAVEARARSLEPGQVLLLENLRFHPEEEANDPVFAGALARLADCYVNDAFASAHPAHPPLGAIPRSL